MRACGCVIVDTRRDSPALEAELSLLEEHELLHKTLFLESGAIAPAVDAQLGAWRAQGRAVLVQDVESAVELIRGLAQATFPHDRTPLDRIVAREP